MSLILSRLLLCLYSVSSFRWWDLDLPNSAFLVASSHFHMPYSLDLLFSLSSHDTLSNPEQMIRHLRLFLCAVFIATTIEWTPAALYFSRKLKCCIKCTKRKHNQCSFCCNHEIDTCKTLDELCGPARLC